MGSSKIIMLSGVYLILGSYTISFHQADRTNSTAVEAVAVTVQAEQYARTGIAIAMEKMGSNGALKAYSAETVTLSDGSIIHQASSISASQSRITSTATFNAKTVTMTAVFSYDRGRWRMIRSYMTPTAETVS